MLECAVNNFARAHFHTVPPKPAFAHQNTTHPQVLPCATPLMNIDPFMFSLGTTQTKKQWKEKKGKYAKLCSRGEVTHALPCLSTQNFSPPNPPMTPSANMDFPFWRLPKPSPRGCSALSWRKGGWEMCCRASRHMHKYFCVSA